MRRLLLGHVLQVEDWLRMRRDLPVLFVSYNRMVADHLPQAERIARFLGNDRVSAPRLAEAVEAGLYRQRQTGAT